MDRRRTFITPTKNTYASDYINNKRSKQKFSGTSNLANTIIQNGGEFPLVARSGYLKPYQGTYGFSSSTQTQGEIPSSYCLNQARSYRDLLDITRGKYLLTPPNPTTTTIELNQLTFSEQLYCGTLYKFNYSNSNVVADRLICNNSYLGGATGPASVDNKIIYNPTSNANQWINVDPNYKLFYNRTPCLMSEATKVLNDVSIRDNSEAKKTVDRFLNMSVEGFSYPVKFSLKYDANNCINANNDLQKP
jgi:hypothetical protein